MKTTTKQRIALSLYFFLTGFCFSTWASRIPTLKDFFNLNEAQLGNLLLVMPISSLLGLPISGWLVSKFDSRVPLLIAFIFFSFSLAIVGFAENLFVLILGICLFSFCMRIINIAMNTQSISLQRSYPKKIIGSFHGIWSSGGLAGVGFSTLLIKLNTPLHQHFLIATVICLILGIFSYRFLLTNDVATEGNKIKLGKPDPFILYLGLLIFLASVCEGGMFDWSGVYFKEVVHEDVFTLGYLVFIFFMALSRFSSDKVIERIGMKRTYLFSSSFISLGIAVMIFFPFLWPAMLGFSLMGIGVAAVIPMTFSLAGTSKKYSAGMAISIIATYGIVGRFLGPPLIGYLAQLFNLQISFVLFLLAGILIIPVSRLFFKRQEKGTKT